jgi:sterol desaturase/sphingolipid hydroxylase (fatty acid hydroxylase superfamily)
MSDNLHTRAEQLIAQERIEEISATEREWLGKHLDECAACSNVANEMGRAIASLRGVHVDLPRGLASRTQMRVRMRAEELRQHSPKRSLLWAITAMSWALGVATAPWVWRGFAWVGEHTGLPKPLWQIGFVLWWAIPAMIAAVAVILEKKGEQQGV